MLDKGVLTKTSHETRIEDDTLLRGLGIFAADDLPAGWTRAAFVRSPHASARIKSVDISAAKAAPGVLAVLTGADMQAAGVTNISRHLPVVGRGGRALAVPPRPSIAKDRVMHIGQAVAMVVAETQAQAMDAAELVTVEYEELKPVIGVREALESGAPQLWDNVPNNLALDWTGPETNTPENVEEVDKIIKGAAHVVKMSIINPRISGVAMEPRGAVAMYDKSEDRHTIRVCSQGVGAMRDALNEVMGLKNVRVLSEDVGGGFGLKTSPYPEYPALMIAAKVTGRPVHWIATRSESFTSDNEARDAIADCELALNERGKFLALRIRSISNVGAFLTPPAALVQSASFTRCLPGMYDIPKIDIQVKIVHTNTMPVGPYRGAGRPEANYTLERLADQAARELNIDRIAIRRRNMVKPKNIPWKNAIGNVIDSGDFETVLDKALALADYDGFKQRKRDTAKRKKLRGFGISCFLEHAGATPLESASLVFPEDGSSLVVGVGVQRNGQGHATVFTRLVMDRLGLGRDKIKFEQGDSDKNIAGNAAVGSRAGQAVGHSISRSVDVMLEKGRKVASHIFEAAESDIDFANGSFTVVGTDRSVSLFDVARRAKDMKARGQITETLDTVEKTNTPITYPNGCHLAEVEIDPDTGVVELVSYAGVDDSGNVLNHVIVEGQVHGGVVQGIGQVLMENTVYEPNGQILSASFMDYAMPKAHHVPPLVTADYPVPATTNPLGVKGVGEAGTTGALAAVMGAIIDAIPNGAAADMNMPATAEKVWQACQKGRA